MAAFLTSLGTSLGMGGAGGIAGGLGTLVGNSIMAPPGNPAQAPQSNVMVGQAQYTDPFANASQKPAPSFMTDSYQEMLDPRVGAGANMTGPISANQYLMNQGRY
jgi:hypothetical protein